MAEINCRICGKYIPALYQAQECNWPVHQECFDKAVIVLKEHHDRTCHDCNVE